MRMSAEVFMVLAPSIPGSADGPPALGAFRRRRSIERTTKPDLTDQLLGAAPEKGDLLLARFGAERGKQRARSGFERELPQHDRASGGDAVIRHQNLGDRLERTERADEVGALTNLHELRGDRGGAGGGQLEAAGALSEVREDDPGDRMRFHLHA